MRRDPIQDAIDRMSVMARELHLLPQVGGMAKEVALEAIDNGLRVAEAAVESLKRLGATETLTDWRPLTGEDLLNEEGREYVKTSSG